MRRIENRHLRCARCFRAPGRATAARRGAPHAQIQDEISLGNHPARGPGTGRSRCTNDPRARRTHAARNRRCATCHVDVTARQIIPDSGVRICM